MTNCTNCNIKVSSHMSIDLKGFKKQGNNTKTTKTFHFCENCYNNLNWIEDDNNSYYIVIDGFTIYQE